MRIGVIGAGRMGRPIVDRLRAAGHEPVVLTRRPAARAAAEASGLRCAGTMKETVRDADVVITVVFDDTQLRAAVLGEDGVLAAMPAGGVLVQHTTCDPATMTLLAEVGARQGIAVLDAALSGNPRDIADGRLTLWVGGDETALARVRPLLDSYASPVLFVGHVGDGQRIKLVNNALFVAQVGLAVDAVRLAGSLGITEEQILAAVQQGSGGSRALSAVAWIGASAVGTRLAELMSKDVDVVRAAARRAGADLGLIGDVLSSDVVVAQVLAGGTPPDRASAGNSKAAPAPMKETPG
ncbi:NAD(P)-dependent oxidoreductase [Trebonia kvetii]|uniref:NAD(P)-dependent oxidoreductase n=1 Tax=Trebonia kvetii TaxID=2480626 RepID=A0A6P2BTM1_9ACTN|nr:NAD(P)-dependent oxidoreductase [Trebonia kvetii]TVZ02459.1 NAD(P)-dependent oxidoreductase [Trebonia kvetii]